MSKTYAKPVFEALNSRTYKTEEEARTASREYLIEMRMRKILITRGDYISTYNLPERLISWFLENRTAFLDAYSDAVDHAAIELAKVTPHEQT